VSIRAFYDRWPQYNQRLVDVVGRLSDAELALGPPHDGWPIWAMVGHIAGTRVYWLCDVLGEPGGETTPFRDPDLGWEDQPDHPRGAHELVEALGSTFAIVQRALDTWTPAMLAEETERRRGDELQIHSRASILQRLLTHEAYHDGEISQILGANGLAPVELWHQLR
jgi:uncharacterized damage-inducible protein DinB